MTDFQIDQKIIDAVRQGAIDGRLSCAKAEELAEELGVRRAVIGQVCEELKIKIKSCQLGCF
ncbi:MAG: hypothetical protein ACYDG6_01200 [Thermincolia bacterium]